MVKLSDSLLKQIKENKKSLSKRDRLFLEELKDGKTYEELVTFLYGFLETLKHSYVINPTFVLLENENHEFSYGRVRVGYREVPKIKKSLNIGKRGYILIGILGVLSLILLFSIYSFVTSKHKSIGDKIEHNISKKVSSNSSSSEQKQKKSDPSSSSTEQSSSSTEQSSSTTEVSQEPQDTQTANLEAQQNYSQTEQTGSLDIQQGYAQTDISTDYTQPLPNTIQ